MLTKAELGAELRARREAVLIVNTGSRRGERSFNAARAGLEARGIHVVESYPVRAGAQLPKLVERTIAAGHRLVVVGGGDGTLSSAVGAFAYADAALGVLPLGTGNSFAQTLTIPQDLGHALDIIAGGNVVDVDLGVVNEAYFSNVATIGLSANVARRTPRWLKRILGPAAYVVIGVVQTFQHNAFIATIGRWRARRSARHASNYRSKWSGVRRNPDHGRSHVDNRSFAIVTLRGKSRWQVHGCGSHFFRGASISCTTRPAQSVLNVRSRRSPHNISMWTARSLRRRRDASRSQPRRCASSSRQHLRSRGMTGHHDDGGIVVVRS